MRLDVDHGQPSLPDANVSGGSVESLSDAVQRELERDLVDQFQQEELHEGVSLYCC